MPASQPSPASSRGILRGQARIALGDTKGGVLLRMNLTGRWSSNGKKPSAHPDMSPQNPRMAPCSPLLINPSPQIPELQSRKGTAQDTPIFSQGSWQSDSSSPDTLLLNRIRHGCAVIILQTTDHMHAGVTSDDIT